MTRSAGVQLPDAMGRLAAGAIAVTVAAAAGPVLGTWLAIIAVPGALVAVLIHGWHDRHPSDLPAPPEPLKGPLQINISSTDVAGNIGGLIFAVGSVLIVAVGLPSLAWFLFAAMVAACLLAWRLVAWHANHPGRGLPENRIVLR